MNLKDIKAMFIVGDVWNGSRTPGWNGEATSTGQRKIEKVQREQYAFRDEHGKRMWGALPKATDVIEARPGYLKFRVPLAVPAIVELRKVE